VKFEKKMNRYKFSICIPTWNRANLLKETLNNLTLQIERKSDFQVVISDNNSTEDTYAVVSEYYKKLNVKYLRWDQNIGGSKNIIQVVNHADGRYCVLLGDDDVFRNGWLESLSHLVDKFNPDVICSDRIVCDIDLNPKFVEKCGPLVSAPTVYNCAEDGILYKYLAQTNSTSGFGFLSNLVVKKTAWDIGIDCDYINNHPFPHLIKILDMLNSGGTILRVPLETVYARTGNHRLEEYMPNSESTEFEKLLTVHFEGFLSAAKFLFPESLELRSGLLNPIRRIFDEKYRIYFLDTAKENNLIDKAENFIYQLDSESFKI
jgi:abequosyltransferase